MMHIAVATPEPGPTRLANPNRKPEDARPKPLIKSIFAITFHDPGTPV